MFYFSWNCLNVVFLLFFYQLNSTFYTERWLYYCLPSLKQKERFTFTPQDVATWSDSHCPVIDRTSDTDVSCLINGSTQHSNDWEKVQTDKSTVRWWDTENRLHQFVCYGAVCQLINIVLMTSSAHEIYTYPPLNSASASVSDVCLARHLRVVWLCFMQLWFMIP